ncbi:uncharacterized protein LOC141690860 [Apium graveolens]|uniref:uncharacterized protein LOC141690860 n=1 Tax=Apium graveolens TaxID=4045 RepID=UPI003D7A5381
MLLVHIKGATSYQDLKSVNGFVHTLFQEACDALGHLKDDRQWDVAISENAVHAMPRQLRQLFVHILSDNQVADPLKLWEKHWESMSEDILLTRKWITNNNELHLNLSDIQNFALAEIEKLFNDDGKSLKDYNSMPFPDDNFIGGCGKTFLWNTLRCKLCSVGRVVLPVASSGIAATLLPGGRTAYSRFHISLKVDEYSVAEIKHSTELGKLLKQTSLIIWDKALMQHRYAAESVDRSLRDIMTLLDPERANLPFGGITIVFGGDFRQMLPVIPKASRAQVVKFSKWVLDVGNGTLPNVHPEDIISDPEVVIPDKFLIRARENPLKAVVDVVYPDLAKNIKNADYLRERSILTPMNAIVGDINSYILDQVPGKKHSYFSQDSLVDSECDNNDFGSAFPIKYLNSINMPCLPKHHLKIKEGCMIMLMRNLNQIMGLCNGTIMIVKRCFLNSIVCDILIGSQVGTTYIIPRIEMEPSDTQWPFEFKRVQFPVQLCYAMTINKSQGQSFHKVGLYFPRSVFTHGQLYVAVSRVTSPSSLHILIDSDSGGYTNVTANVIFEEVFYNFLSKDNHNRIPAAMCSTPASRSS